MKLPRRGFLVDEAGAIIWAWEHNNPTVEFDTIGPFQVDAEGNAQTFIPPQGTVVDLDAEDLAPQEIAPFLQDISNARFRKGSDGKCRILRVTSSAEGLVEEIHPIVHVLNARRRLKNRPLLPSALETKG